MAIFFQDRGFDPSAANPKLVSRNRSRAGCRKWAL